MFSCQSGSDRWIGPVIDTNDLRRGGGVREISRCGNHWRASFTYLTQGGLEDHLAALVGGEEIPRYCKVFNFVVFEIHFVHLPDFKKWQRDRSLAWLSCGFPRNVHICMIVSNNKLAEIDLHFMKCETQSNLLGNFRHLILLLLRKLFSLELPIKMRIREISRQFPWIIYYYLWLSSFRAVSRSVWSLGGLKIVAYHFWITSHCAICTPVSEVVIMTHSANLATVLHFWSDSDIECCYIEKSNYSLWMHPKIKKIHSSYFWKETFLSQTLLKLIRCDISRLLIWLRVLLGMLSKKRSILHWPWLIERTLPPHGLFFILLARFKPPSYSALDISQFYRPRNSTHPIKWPTSFTEL